METVDVMNEIWKSTGIGNYEVSNEGRVRVFYPSKNRYKIMKTSFNNTKGYERIELRCKNERNHCSVHRLVALAFIPNPLDKPEVNHIDENKANNHVSNLEWVTASENVQHSIQTWRDKAHTKEVSCYTKNLIWVATYISVREASRQTGYLTEGISRAANGITKTCNGFKWSYSEDIVQSS